jgi:selenocysteine lyase/cysteine desulfurase
MFRIKMIQTNTAGLGLEKTEGVVRAGLAHYNTREEVDFCLKCLREAG